MIHQIVTNGMEKETHLMKVKNKAFYIISLIHIAGSLLWGKYVYYTTGMDTIADDKAPYDQADCLYLRIAAVLLSAALILIFWRFVFFFA